MNDRYKLSLALVFLTLFLSYSMYLYTHQPMVTPTVTTADGNGKMVWQKYNCNACHQIYGLGGYLGPDLTNAYSKRGNDYINAFLESGTNVMPNLHLTQQERSDLIAFLKTVDASGSADPKSFKFNINGTIEQ